MLDCVDHWGSYTGEVLTSSAPLLNRAFTFQCSPVVILFCGTLAYSGYSPEVAVTHTHTHRALLLAMFTPLFDMIAGTGGVHSHFALKKTHIVVVSRFPNVNVPIRDHAQKMRVAPGFQLIVSHHQDRDF